MYLFSQNLIGNFKLIKNYNESKVKINEKKRNTNIPYFHYFIVHKTQFPAGLHLKSVLYRSYLLKL